MGDLIGAYHSEQGAPNAGEMLAAIVCELMADRRARLASGAAPREVSAAEATPEVPRESPDHAVPAPEHPPTHPAHA